MEMKTEVLLCLRTVYEEQPVIVLFLVKATYMFYTLCIMNKTDKQDSFPEPVLIYLHASIMLNKISDQYLLSYQIYIKSKCLETMRS